MVAGAPGSIIGQSIELFDHHDRCQPRRPVRLLLVLAVAATALTACAWDPPTIERTPREAAGTEPSAKSRLAARKGTVQSGTAASGATGEKIDVPGDMAALEVDLTNFKERLIGLDSDEINDLMGTPSLERAEPPALIWQYRHQVCTVDIFMFDDGGGSTVDHVEVRPTGGTNANDKECFTALLRNVPQSGAGNAKAGPPIAAAPSTAVGRRATPSAAPPSGPAQTPSSSRPPVPSTAAPSAAPTAPPRPAASAVPEGEEGPPPTDTDIDFDFGASNTAAPAPPSAFPPVVQNRAPSPAPAASAPGAASPSSEAMPTLPDEFSDAIGGASSGAKPAPGSVGATTGDDDADFADPLDSAPPKAPPPTAAATAKPSLEKPAAPTVTAKPAPSPAPLAAVPPAPTPAPPVVAPAVVTPSVAAVPPPPPPPATVPAPLSPRGATATTAQAQPQSQPKGAVKGAAKGAAVAADEIEDEDLPPGAAGLRADDPSRNNQDMVE